MREIDKNINNRDLLLTSTCSKNFLEAIPVQSS